MEEKAIFWNAYSQELEGDIHGKYNAYRLYFELKTMINEVQFKYNGKRQLQNATGSSLPVKAKISEELKVVSIKGSVHHLDWFQLVRRTFFNRIRLKLFNGFDKLEKIGGYYLIYNEPFSHHLVCKYKITELEKLNKVVHNTNGLSITMNNLPTDINELKRIFNFCFAIHNS